MKRQRSNTGHNGFLLSATMLLFTDFLLACPPPPCPPCYSNWPSCDRFCWGIQGYTCCPDFCCLGDCCSGNICCSSRICCDGKCCPYGACCNKKCCYNGPHCCGETCCPRAEDCCQGRCCFNNEECCGGKECCVREKCCNKQCCGDEEKCCDGLTCYKPHTPYREQCCGDGSGTVCPENTKCCLDGICATKCEPQTDITTCYAESKMCPSCGFVCEEHYAISYTRNPIYNCKGGCPGDCQDDGEVVCSTKTRCTWYLIGDYYCDTILLKDCLPANWTSACIRCQKDPLYQPEEITVTSKKCAP